MNLLHRVMREHPHPRTVCEVGVNAGHSSAIWLTARPDMETVVYVAGSCVVALRFVQACNASRLSVRACTGMGLTWGCTHTLRQLTGT